MRWPGSGPEAAHSCSPPAPSRCSDTSRATCSGSSRILFAFGLAGLLPRRLAAVHGATRAPHVAILAHTVLAAALAMSGTFTILAPLSSVAILILYLGCCAAAFVLMRRSTRESASKANRLAALSPVVAIVGLLWVLSYSTRPELLAVAVVLAAGTAIYLATSRARSGPARSQET